MLVYLLYNLLLVLFFLPMLLFDCTAFGQQAIADPLLIRLETILHLLTVDLNLAELSHGQSIAHLLVHLLRLVIVNTLIEQNLQLLALPSVLKISIELSQAVLAHLCIIKIFLFNAAIQQQTIDHIVQHIYIQHPIGVTHYVLQKCVSCISMYSQLLQDESQTVCLDEVIKQMILHHCFEMPQTFFVTEVRHTLFNKLLVLLSQRFKNWPCFKL